MTTLIVGSGGIGLAAARRIGGEPVLTYRRNEPADPPPGATLRRLDVTDPVAVAELVASVPGLDAVVVTSGHRHDFEFFAKQDPAVAEEIVATELLGPMNVVRAALGALGDRGRIVLVGSDSGKAGTLGDAASSAARAGLLGFVRSIARETARTDVTVNVVSPGPTDTGLLGELLDGDDLAAKVMRGTVAAIPKRRTAQPEEIAEAIAYFLGPNSGFTTGQVLSVSGGLTMT
ncbi:SDR family NAD(P)-dependent oxidoreductase [Corynebacterium guangdongense]|uniref:2-hydroxycyclohexanecarboxyl-CoA dehydrogenase n=1 Tax=Corynebacterium guangdongense TaxID=1783348 RepID=A0ABU1ZTY6_9CORY|nr:SDR family oxidoreductase [Corynebacterium guangdongense]MDR7328387.1 2-hydroxycyclohexanecarboxyl-CoA dehydrogenase [Corynebacterium guangdongense]WJZ16964.1 3-oxoacyl-[acyl-carrier-protein] reductase FabG [Corynebacterium guangdongense]